MKKVLQILVAIVAFPQFATASDFWDKLLYPTDMSHPESEITVQNTWSWGNDHKYDGFIITATDLAHFTRFQIELAFSDSFHYSSDQRDITIPDGVTLGIEGLGELDVGGASVGTLSSEATRSEMLIIPSLSIPLYQWQTMFKLRKGLQFKFEARVGLGYEIRAFLQETTFTAKILADEDSEGEKISLPYTDSGIKDGVSSYSAIIFDLGVIHTEQQLSWSYPNRVRFTTGIGARW